MKMDKTKQQNRYLFFLFSIGYFFFCSQSDIFFFLCCLNFMIISIVIIIIIIILLLILLLLFLKSIKILSIENSSCLFSFFFLFLNHHNFILSCIFSPDLILH